MPGLNAGDILQVTVIGTLAGQRVLSVFHYNVLVGSTATEYVPAAQNFADNFDGGTTSPLLSMLACQGNAYHCDRVRVQRIYPTRDAYVESIVDLPGLRVGTVSAPNHAAVVTKRGPLANRHNTGSLHLAGIINTDMFDGFISTDLQVLLNVVGSKFLSVYIPPLGGTEARMIIYNKQNPALSVAPIATSVHNTVRTMHRRTVGLGI